MVQSVRRDSLRGGLAAGNQCQFLSLEGPGWGSRAAEYSVESSAFTKIPPDESLKISTVPLKLTD